jgi:hypothetical protein
MSASRRAGIAALALALVLAGGCATPSDPAKMVAATAPAGHRSDGSISVAVTGGQETSSVHSSQISDAAFAQALRDSLATSGLFAAVKDEGTYKLNAHIGKLSQPKLGFDMKVDMEVGYTLVDTRSGERVLRKSIASSHVATTGDALAGVDRVRLANEGAARKNIEAFLAEVARLRLP